MKHVDFPESNAVLRGGPADKYGTADDVADLPIWRGEGRVISCWRLSFWERMIVLFRGRVWLHVAGSTHPPVCVGARWPWREYD